MSRHQRHQRHQRHEHRAAHPSGSSELSVGSIEQGTVARIEAYGAFVQLQDHPHMRGLVHISQLSTARVEQVSDVVAVGDSVWVQVVEVEEMPNPDGGRPKMKICLTMKDIPQDGTAREAQRNKEQSFGLSHSIEQNLNSTIGMAVARDPMANQGSNQLIFKQNMRDGKGATVINGYALLEDDDDFVPPPVPAKHLASKIPVAAPRAEGRPMGRGRGTTLPAWMVQQQREKEEKAEDRTDHKRSKDERRHKKSKHSTREKYERKKKKHKRSKRREKDTESNSDGSDRLREKSHRWERTKHGSGEERDDSDGSDIQRKKRHRQSKARYNSDDDSDGSRRRRRDRKRRKRSASGG